MHCRLYSPFSALLSASSPPLIALALLGMADSWAAALVGFSLASTAAVTAALFVGHLRSVMALDAADAPPSSPGVGLSDWASQRLFLRIGLAAPLLAALCAVALLVPGSAIECELVLSLYEGYTLYLFYAMLLLHLGGEVCVCYYQTIVQVLVSQLGSLPC